MGVLLLYHNRGREKDDIKMITAYDGLNKICLPNVFFPNRHDSHQHYLPS